MIDVSALSTQRPLLIGEAPIAKGLSPFAPWHMNSIPETTRELLDLAFGVQENRSQSEAEKQHAILHDTFDLSNILSDVQEYINPLDKYAGHDFDIMSAIRILVNEIQTAINYAYVPEGPIPKLYGRIIIVFGRVGEALALANAIVAGAENYDDIIDHMETDRLYRKESRTMVTAFSGSKLKCVANFIWVYHPSHFIRNSDSETKIKYRIAAKREVVSRILRAGMSHTLLDYADCASDIIPLRFFKIRKKSDKKVSYRPAYKIRTAA